MNTNKNTIKGVSYSYAFSQMKKGIEEGFFIETIAIAESIITDRVQFFALGRGWKGMHKNWKLEVMLANAIEGALSTVNNDIDIETINLLNNIKIWKDQYRNKIIHQLAKSEPGTPTMGIDEFLETAKIGAEEGIKYARKICDWHRKQKKICQ